MYTNNASSSNTDAISQLISKVMGKYDADKDGRLSSNEFGSFLTGLLGGPAGQQSGTGAASAASAAGGTAATDGTSGTYRERFDGDGPYRFYLAGFDHNNLDNPAMQTVKYRAARVFIDFKPQPENLPAIVDRLQQIGINAKQVSSDKIDFGDGWGPIDVIQGAYPGGGVAWQWLRPETSTT